MMKYITLMVILAFVLSDGKAQDPQFSQFYSAPLYLAPSFAGSTDGGRVILNWRDQWPQLSSTFITYAFSADYYLDKYRSGIGLLVLRDEAGEDGLVNSTNIGLVYSFNFDINPNWRVRPGLSAYYYTRGINYNAFRFGDQILRGGSSGAAGSSVEMTSIQNMESVNHFDFTTSVLAYSKRYWFGFTLDHLMSFSEILASEGDYLAPRYSAFMGAKYVIPGKTLKVKQESICVAMNFMIQNKVKYLDLGMYYTKEPLSFGLWYRGLPVFPNNMNVGALALSVGYKYKAMQIVYSYDFTLTRLVTQTGGAHEISLSYSFIELNKRRVRRNMVPCPGL
ncbi:MAG: type IX secretion system membrane protein PorP/SprF [Bacteroidetes bacterium]|nr:type IX secretion system membrane protein PorP/SprF [Bacteroidota bacterium]